MPLASAEDGQGYALTVLDDDVYWVEPGPNPRVRRTSLLDGSTHDLALPDEPGAMACVSDARDMASDDRNVYVLCGASVLRYRSDTDAWSVHSLSLDSLELRSLLTVGDTLYVTLLDGIAAYSRADLKLNQGWYTIEPHAIATDGMQLFATLWDATAGGTRISKLVAGEFEPIGPPLPPPSSWQSLVVGPTHAYTSSDTRIVRVPVAGSDREELVLEDAPNQPYLLVMDEQALYFMDQAGLHAVELATGTRTQLAAFDPLDAEPGGMIVRGLAQSEDYLVWVSNLGLSRIRK